MSHQYEPVGIIEINADPTLDASLDGSIGDTLRELRRADPPHSDLNSGACWDPGDESLQDSVVVLKANLRQLRSELENELTKFINRLLARR